MTRHTSTDGRTDGRAKIMIGLAAVSTPVQCGRRTAVAHRRRRRLRREFATAALDCGEIACAVSDDDASSSSVKIAVVNGRSVSARGLRSCEIVDASGKRTTIAARGSATGGPDVVVLLRHLGWLFCWSAAREAADRRERIEAAGGSLTLASIGSVESLEKFLELNPTIPRDVAFVDDSESFALYEAAGFGKFTDAKPDKVELKPTNFSAGDWWKYLTNVAKLAPIKKGEKLSGVPEGVLRLGGTFVLRGEDVEYAWADALPGDHPNIDDVLRKVNVPA